jgi:hypothetical protein
MSGMYQSSIHVCASNRDLVLQSTLPLSIFDGIAGWGSCDTRHPVACGPRPTNTSPVTLEKSFGVLVIKLEFMSGMTYIGRILHVPDQGSPEA